MEKLEGEGCKTQFIWVGLIDGDYHNTVIQGRLGKDENGEEVCKESWIVLVNEKEERCDRFSFAKNCL